MPHYWIHRISHHAEVSYPMLDQGYLTIGWSSLSQTDVLDVISHGRDAYRKFMDALSKEKEDPIFSSKSRWGLWYFANMAEGDIIVVPMFNKEFGIYEVVNKARPIFKLGPKVFSNKAGEKFSLTTNEFVNQMTEGPIDLGFYIEVRKIIVTKRAYADARLQSRMKIFQTSANIDDLQEEVERAKTAKEPQDIRGQILYAVSQTFAKESMFAHYTPDQVELLVKYYFDKTGASEVTIPSKNDSNKAEGSDADVIAVFEDLDVVFYVQVKHHKGESDCQAVEQISSYLKDYGYDPENGVTNIPWALTTAVFSKDAKDLAIKKRVRLIEGKEFAEMLMKVGISGLNISNV